MESEYSCDKCKLPMHNIMEVGYLGDPNGPDADFECNPTMELMCLCPECTPVKFLTHKDKDILVTYEKKISR
tara:strand:- start:2986 stop:3201 length:216 start_codon:yes stop_codon:yes gene_type:complete